ncbi:MAG: transketolase [Kiritimatiellae bacterium]|nr:transketolase [Kiritimatiellia bacterium]
MDLQLVANTIRGLAMDGVQRANSGHPGMPMGTADFAAVLFLKFLKHDPAAAEWPDRDRFVLSGGHGSMLLYSLLHLAGYPLGLDELKAFRQWGSKTPGHPERGLTPGVETTTGPLGQGCGNGVGMALAEAMLAQRFNENRFGIVDHYTYVLATDGDLMEGVSHEAFSLAGHLGLHKLVVFYDSNRITIEGATELTYSDNVRKRFQGYNWNVLEVDGHDFGAIEAALDKARKQKKKPTLIIGHTHIAKGSPTMQDTAESHGAPLGADEVKAAKQNLGLPADQDFYVPQAALDAFAERRRECAALREKWEKKFNSYRKRFPEKAALWDGAHEHRLPENLAGALPAFDPAAPIATRSASGKVMQGLAKLLPALVGGAADLAPSTKTILDGFAHVAPGSFGGRNLHFGVREHAMGAMLNGMALHGGFRVYGATFFVFVDYCRPAVRLAAIMGLPVIYVFTHDSFYVGEDGPTHEPVEQLASLRAMPGLTLIRPADATETAAAWLAALENTSGPTALLLTRQNLPVLDRTVYPPAALLKQGAYTLWQSREGIPQVLLIASGSEVALALQAAKELADSGPAIRVVSMPSWELFDRQPKQVQDDVLPPACTMRLAIEAGSTIGWEKYVGSAGRVLGMNRFGVSAPYKVLAEKFGFTPQNVVRIVREMVAGQ